MRVFSVADIYTEEEEWSDEFDDDAEEATPGFLFFLNFNLIYFKLATLKYQLKTNRICLWIFI